MAILETAGKYLLDIFSGNEEAKKFGKDFITATVNWIRPWFLTTDIPRNIDKLDDPTRAADSKKEIIAENLKALEGNAEFMKELEAKLAEYATHRQRIKHLVKDANIDVKGNIHIGDKGAAGDDGYDQKGIIKGGTFKAGGDFRLGDDIVQANTVIQHHYHGGVSGAGSNAPKPVAPFKAELKALVASGKTGDALGRLLDHAETTDREAHNTALLLSGRLQQLNRRVNQGITGNDEANLERNRITNAVLAVIDGLPG